MKIRHSACCLLALATLSSPSCKEKPKTPETPKTQAKSTVEKAQPPIEQPPTQSTPKPLTPDQRAAKLGFAQYLPKDTEMVFSLYNAKTSSDQLRALSLVKLIEKTAGIPIPAPTDPPPLDQPIPAATPGPWTLFGQEFTLAFGKTSATQLGHLITLNQRMGYFQAKALGSAAQAFAKSGDSADFSSTLNKEMGEDLFTSILKDPKSGIELLEQAEFPPIYLAFRAKPGELEQAAELLNSGLSIFGMAGEMAAPVSLSQAGSDFTGFKLIGAEVAKTFAAARQSLDDSLGTESTDRLIAAIAKKDLIAVTGTLGEYVVMMIGGSEADLQLVPSPSESILSTDQIAFADAFSEKQLLFFAHSAHSVFETIAQDSSTLSPYALGLRDGISSPGALGDTRDLAALLEIVSDREKSLLSLAKTDTFGLLAYSENGLKIESFGGYDSSATAWDKNTTLSHLGANPENLLFLNTTPNPTYNAKMHSYVEAIIETAYAATAQLSALGIDAPELIQINKYTKLFDETFRSDLIGLYTAFGGDYPSSFGNESALVIDLNGAIPAIPGLPQALIDSAKAPRISLISPLTDRAKLASAWAEMNTRTTSLLGKISEISKTEIPMLKPISSESNGAKTWFFSLPYLEDNFMPSVTLSDQWFVASTSKTHALELINKAQQAPQPGKSLQFFLNFKTLAKYAGETLAAVDKNSAALFPDEATLATFNQNKTTIQEAITAAADFDSLSISSAQENGKIHSSIHFKTK